MLMNENVKHFLKINVKLKLFLMKSFFLKFQARKHRQNKVFPVSCIKN